MAYFEDNYNFNPWVEIDLSLYDKAYSIFWYRANADALNDKFLGNGWELVDETYDSNIEKDVLLSDRRRKEDFKVIVFFNHEKYESNILSFENTSNFDEIIIDLSSFITI
jgi:hypothetical protein